MTPSIRQYAGCDYTPGRDFDAEEVACTVVQLRTCINELEAEMAALRPRAAEMS